MVVQADAGVIRTHARDVPTSPFGTRSLRRPLPVPSPRLRWRRGGEDQLTGPQPAHRHQLQLDGLVRDVAHGRDTPMRGAQPSASRRVTRGGQISRNHC